MLLLDLSLFCVRVTVTDVWCLPHNRCPDACGIAVSHQNCKNREGFGGLKKQKRHLMNHQRAQREVTVHMEEERTEGEIISASAVLLESSRRIWVHTHTHIFYTYIHIHVNLTCRRSLWSHDRLD
jgi:hypothetical protein